MISAKKKLILKIFMTISVLMVMVLISDFALGLIGFSDEAEIESHPLNYKKFLDNIEGGYLFETNSLGLRYKEIPLMKPEKTFRVFVSGDSYTEGTLIPTGSRITDLLETRFSKDNAVNFINGGLAGSGPMQYTKIFIKKGRKYEPDAWLIMVFVNDLIDTPIEISQSLDGSFREKHTRGALEIAHHITPRYYTILSEFKQRRAMAAKTQSNDLVETVRSVALQRNIPIEKFDLWKQRVSVDLIQSANQGRFNGSILTNAFFYPNYWTDSIDIESPSSIKKLENMKLILESTITDAVNDGIQTAVVFIPSRFMYDPASHSSEEPWIMGGAIVRKEWLDIDTKLQREIRKLTQKIAVPYLDLTSEFRRLPVSEMPQYCFKYDGHLNVQGNQYVASLIENWLKTEKVFKFIK